MRQHKQIFFLFNSIQGTQGRGLLKQVRDMDPRVGRNYEDMEDR